MIDTINTTLNCAPKRLNSIDVSDTRDILLSSVLNNLVGVTKLLNLTVAAKLISENYGFILFSNVAFNHWQKSIGFNIRNYVDNSLAVALNHAHSNGLTRCTTTTFASLATTDVSLIYFNLTRQWVNVFRHEHTDMLEDSPSCFVGDSKLSLKLLSGDSSLSRGHQEDSMKPRTERGIRLVEDSSRSRRYCMTAKLTAVNLAFFYAIVRSNLLTLITVNSIKPTLILEKLKASIFRRELFVEIFYGIGLHVFSRPLYLYLYHIRNIPCCQGIIAIYYYCKDEESIYDIIPIKTWHDARKRICNSCGMEIIIKHPKHEKPIHCRVCKEDTLELVY